MSINSVRLLLKSMAVHMYTISLFNQNLVQADRELTNFKVVFHKVLTDLITAYAPYQPMKLTEPAIPSCVHAISAQSMCTLLSKKHLAFSNRRSVSRTDYLCAVENIACHTIHCDQVNKK